MTGSRFALFFLPLILVTSAPALAETQVVTLGAGTPVLDYQRAGAGVAVVYNGRAYLFDVGGGVVQRAIEANQRLGIQALSPINIQRVFPTHLHSDHMLDFPELAATLWWRRPARLEAWGPQGLEALTRGFVEMMSADIAIRNQGVQPVSSPDGYRVDAHDSEPGVLLEEDGIRIEAFSVEHGAVEPAFGYRITTPDKTVVISGDTSYSQKLVEMAADADILLHEVISEAGLAPLEPSWQRYHSSSHTTTSDLERVAKAAKPRLLVLYHVLHYGAPIESALEEVRALYDGEVRLANDLDVF